MAADRYTEISREGLGSRLGGSFKNIIVGLILFLVAFPLLFWNEGRAVKEYKSLKEGEGLVVSISPQAVTPADQGKLVHFSGVASTDEVLKDELFGVGAEGLRLERQVEMYQWVEDEKTETTTNTGGSQTRKTTYEYRKSWSDDPINSQGFRYPEGHANPGVMPFRDQQTLAQDARVGNILMPATVLQRINAERALAPENPTFPDAGRPARVVGETIYYGEDPDQPAVGDLRVSFRIVPETAVSVVARLSGQSLDAYPTEAGNPIFLVETGTVPASAMFESAHRANAVLTWILRGVGFFMMVIGLSALMGPLRVLADVLPFLGRIVGLGVGIVAFALAAVFSSLTIAVAWLIYRPLLAVALFALGGGIIYWLGKRGAQAADTSAAEGAAVSPPPPPPGG